MKQNELLTELTARGFVYQCSNLDGLNDALNVGKITTYWGTDPTGDSLHVGHLASLMLMRWFQKFGHNPIGLVGGATGRVGDVPSKVSDSARPALTDEQVERNLKGLRKSIEKILPGGILMVDNYEWQKKYGHLEFLREYGASFTIAHMMTMESVKRRMEHGLTFQEFNYMTIQAVDFFHLYKEHNCIVQLCGADQWGNSIMGVELIRKKLGKEAFVLSTPILTDSNGEKIGKSAGNAVWVNEDKTSPYEYYQYFRNTPDDLVEKFLKIFTEISLDEIAKLMQSPNINDVKKILAFAATEIAHGRDAAHGAENEIPVVNAAAGKLSDIVATVYGLSKSEARRNIEQGGISIDDATHRDPNEIITTGEYIFQKGKKKMFTKVVVK